MSTFFEVRKEAEAVINESIKLAKEMGFGTYEERLRDILVQYQEKEFIVVVAGEAKRGKSSMLNALLGEVDEIFPVDADVCTNVATIVRYGDAEKVTAVIENDKDGSSEEIAVSRSEIKEYVSEKENPGNFRNVRYIKIELPNPLLKEGICFVDTPGVGSMNIMHAEMTLSFLPLADLLVFVGDSVSGYTESELKFLKRGYGFCQNVLFPLTKKDLNAQWQQILEDNKEKIGKTLEIPQEKIHIIPISSTNKMAYLKTGNERRNKSSNYDDLEREMETLIAGSQAERCIVPFLNAAQGEMTGMLKDIQASARLLDTDREELLEIKDALEDAKAKTAELAASKNTWSEQIRRFSNSLADNEERFVSETKEKADGFVENQIKVKREKICDKKIYEGELLPVINDMFVTCALDAVKAMEANVDNEIDTLNRRFEIDLKISKTIYGNSSPHFEETLDIVFPRKKIAERVQQAGKSAGSGLVAGAFVGGAIGGLVGLIIGGPVVAVALAEAGAEIGSDVGMLTGGLEGLAGHDMQDVDEVARGLRRHVDNCARRTEERLRKAAEKAGAEVQISFETGLLVREKEIQAQIAKTQNLLESKPSIEEQQRKRENLERQKDEISGQKERVQSVLDSLVGIC
ncbi:MAG: dynamin family protein [Lachnospiraceae bacterium]|nr:dynamin family protein [Lachnospiraceae bacterium]